MSQIDSGYPMEQLVRTLAEGQSGTESGSQEQTSQRADIMHCRGACPDLDFLMRTNA
jgi:hypothetical protein